MIEKLTTMYPWPSERPDVPHNWHGWFGLKNVELLSRYVNAETKLIIELGSWLGSSTRGFLRAAPNATVVAVDHWQGSEEHWRNPIFQQMLPTLYETFLVNCWEYQTRLIPMRETTQAGLRILCEHKVQPDLIYIDASHKYEDVLADIKRSRSFFPHTVICGDDWAWESVRSAVQDFIRAHGLGCTQNGVCWVLRDQSSIEALSY